MTTTNKTTIPMAVKRNWFNTLNEALDSENLIEFWPCGLNITYDQAVQHHAETEQGIRLISVTRDTFGRYERPISYLCG
ncbi:MAG: hypothetical protein WCH01_21915 [Methylococcaceae bacterium]